MREAIMDWLVLPAPRQQIPPAFSDLESARTWLARQPQAQAPHMLAALSLQIEALDAAALPFGDALPLLDLLRRAAVPQQHALEARYLRKPLPMSDEDNRIFELSQRLWFRLGIAYLRNAMTMPAAEQAYPLNRAGSAFRMAQHCHFQASRECPAELDQLLLGTLALGWQSNSLQTPIPDPDFPHLGDSSLGGHLAWALLLRKIDPAHLTAAQFAVANRALSRWRELALVQVAPDDDPRAHSIDLSSILGCPIPKACPRWLEVRKIERKIAQRLAALKAGESPESLKLGRELSGSACSRLLKDIEQHLEMDRRRPSTEVGQIELAFGLDKAYALLTGDFLSPGTALDTESASLSHQRVALFGFDRLSNMPTAVKKLSVPSEIWQRVDGRALRDGHGERRQTHCLICSHEGNAIRVGILAGLTTTGTGQLSADLRWFAGELQALALPLDPPRRTRPLPALLINDDGCRTLLVPVDAGLSTGSTVMPGNRKNLSLNLGEIIERGSDFIRYAITRS